MAQKRYRHVGTEPVEIAGRERQPGEEFSASLPEDQEKYFKTIGALKPVRKSAKSSRKKK